MAISYSYLQQPVISSLVLTQKDDDSFFNPTGLLHTGYAYDGYHYSQGVQNPDQQASWFLEPQSGTRGTQPFPTDLLVILNEASLVLLDTTNDTIALWMLFYYLDSGAFPNNFTAGIANAGVSSYTPQSVTWGNGLLSVVSKGDPGNPFSPYCVVTLDFVQDSAYVDFSVTPA